MNGDDVRRVLRRISHEIVERHRGVDDVLLIGIHTRGVQLAAYLQSAIVEIDEPEIPMGELDVTGHRDDRPDTSGSDGEKSDIPFDLADKTVVLVDDVIFTGRTVRAAMDALLDRGRPAQIELAVLVDRGHRELPIRPDYVGKNVPTASVERVAVHVRAIEGDDGVWIERTRH